MKKKHFQATWIHLGTRLGWKTVPVIGKELKTERRTKNNLSKGMKKFLTTSKEFKI